MVNGLTGAEAGLSLDDQVTLALRAIAEKGGSAPIQVIYDAVEKAMPNQALSDQGRASLRRIVNSYAVQAHYIYPHDKNNPGWRITPEGRDFLAFEQEAPKTIEVVDVDSETVRVVPANAVRGEIFERHIEILLKHMYPTHAWTHTGRYKRNERGLDFYGVRLTPDAGQPNSIGVQTNLHQPGHAPLEIEWLKFLSGCFARQVNLAVFITTGRLTGEQHREAVEARVVVVAGREEVNRICAQFNVEPFTDFALESAI